MNTAALRITFGAELNASARVMVLAYAELIVAIDQRLEWPREMDFTLYGPAHAALAERVGELGRDHAFELVLLGREIAHEHLKYTALMRGLHDRKKWVLETAPDRFVAARALADRIDAFVEKLLCDVPAGEPPASSAEMCVTIDAGLSVSAKPSTGTNGLPSIDVLITKLDSAMARRIRSGQISSRFGVRPRPGDDDVPA